MKCVADTPSAGPARVVDLMQVRARRVRQREGEFIATALRQRVRYRYVQPRVEAREDGWVVRSPCCSRNVDPDGGEIDIAWLQRGIDGLWTLHARDHGSKRWAAEGRFTELGSLLDVLCVDTQRRFWP